MKLNRLFFIFFSVIISHIGAIANFFPSSTKLSFNTPNFGKTHFIFGYPKIDSSKVEQTKICPTNSDLSHQLRDKNGRIKQALFSPDDNVQDALIQLIDCETESIKAAIYSFTDGKIAQALVNAKNRGVLVEIISDPSGAHDKFSKIKFLKEHKVPIFEFKNEQTTLFNNLMHNKFVIFGKNCDGKSLLWTGSFNFTKSAKRYNQENVIILDDEELIERYRKQFSILKERAKHKNSILAQKKKCFITTIPS